MPAPGCSTSSEGERLEPGSPWLGRGPAQSSPRSESEDERSSAMLRMAFSMGARLPLGVMPMGWITFSLQPGERGKVRQSCSRAREQTRNTAGMWGLWKWPETSLAPLKIPSEKQGQSQP